MVACVVGDGEAETGPLATAWHSNKFLSPITDGAVLPILHLNGYKIANPAVLARIPREDRLTYRRTNHGNLHVRGYKEEGTITTPFDMAVLNELDRFHLAMDVIDRLSQLGASIAYLKQELRNKLIEHANFIVKHGDDLPEIREWKWGPYVAAETKAPPEVRR